MPGDGRRQQNKVPDATKGWLIFASDRRCCVCQEPGHHAHHISGDSQNHTRDNLAFLCFSCHDKASQKGGLSSKLTAHAIRAYRDHWHATVKTQRDAERRGPLVQESTKDMDWGQLILDKLAVMEVRKLAHLSPDEWGGHEGRIRHLRQLFPYTWRYSLDVRAEVLETARELAGVWSSRTPSELAEAMADVVLDVLPIGVGPYKPISLTDAEMAVVDFGATLGFEISYNAARYMEDLRAVQAGANVLEKILRLAVLNGDEKMIEAMKNRFAHAMANAFPDGKAWLEVSMKNALRAKDAESQDHPAILVEALYKKDRRRHPPSLRRGSRKGNARDCRVGHAPKFSGGDMGNGRSVTD